LQKDWLPADRRTTSGNVFSCFSGIFPFSSDTTIPTPLGNPVFRWEVRMNISAAGSFDVARSVAEMGDLLKQMTSSKIGLEDKFMKVSVTEQVENSNIGTQLDVSA
jgi:hypothetical protein